MEFQNVRKILIFKLCCFGDTVFMTPSIHSLKKAYPEAKIYYAYSQWVRSMMSYLPDIDGSILFENVYDRSFLSRVRGALKFIKQVRAQKFDLVLNGHRSNDLSLILALCGIRYRLGFAGTKYLTHSAPFNSGIKEYLRYLEILESNGITPQNVLPFLNKPETTGLRFSLGILPGKKVIGIFPNAGSNPGTQMSIKKYDLENFLELARIINEKHPDVILLIFEGKSAFEKFDLPENLIAVKKEIDNDLIACCDMFISADTGSLHIAAALGVSTVSIFGPSDPRLLAPVNPPGEKYKHRYIWLQPPCSPCYTPQSAIEKNNTKYWQGDNFICYTGTNECIKSITPEYIYTILKKSLLESDHSKQ
jgi:ADP-heptose:LPS heptosyltransferase